MNSHFKPYKFYHKWLTSALNNQAMVDILEANQLNQCDWTVNYAIYEVKENHNSHD